MHEELGGGSLPDMDILGTSEKTETLPMKRKYCRQEGNEII
jgi:hypothetical protein